MQVEIDHDTARYIREMAANNGASLRRVANFLLQKGIKADINEAAAHLPAIDRVERVDRLLATERTAESTQW